MSKIFSFELCKKNTFSTFLLFGREHLNQYGCWFSKLFLSRLCQFRLKREDWQFCSSLNSSLAKTLDSEKLCPCLNFIQKGTFQREIFSFAEKVKARLNMALSFILGSLRKKSIIILRIFPRKGRGQKSAKVAPLISAKIRYFLSKNTFLTLFGPF